MNNTPALPRLLIALALLLAAAGFIIPIGTNTPDEILYSLMAQNMAERGSLAIENGYAAYPSPALELKFTVPHAGQIYPQYPPFYALVAAPFYLLAGLHGLMLMNILAFPGVMLLTFRIARRLTGDTTLAALSVGILLAGTYLWPFAFAIWPHMLTLLLILLACWLHLGGRHLLAGLMLGFACGIRVDALFAAPAILLPMLFARPVVWKGTGAALGGMAIAFALLSLANLTKFGTWLPFSYGTAAGSSSNSSLSAAYLIFAAGGMLVLAMAWGISRAAPHRRALYTLPALLMFGGGVALLYLTLPNQLGKLFYGLWFTVVDIRLAMLDKIPGTRVFTESGGVLYYGEFKRALLQSCPFIMLAGLLPFLWRGLVPQHRKAVLWLMLVPLCYIGVFAWQAWEGGYGYNMRYLLPALPFLSMLAALVIMSLCARWAITLKEHHGMAALVIGAALTLLCLRSPMLPLAPREWLANLLPLWLGGAALLVTLACLAVPLVKLRPLALYMLLPALLWGGVTSATLHFPKEVALRRERVEMAELVAPYIRDDALVLALHHQVAGLHFTKPNLRVAHFGAVPREDLRPLLQHHLEQGTQVVIARNIILEPVVDALTAWGFRVIPLDIPANPYNLVMQQVVLP